MASEIEERRGQINITVDDETEEAIARLIPAFSKALNVKFNKSSLIRMILLEADRKISKSKRTRP